MGDLYTYSAATRTLITSTCRMTDHTLYNNEGFTYEDVTKDLCRCMLAAIAADDAQGKLCIGYALYTLLGSVLTEE